MPELMWSPPSSQQSRRSPCSRTSQLSLAVVSFTVKSRSAPVLGVVGGDTSGPRGDKGAGDAGLGLTPRTRGLAGTDGGEVAVKYARKAFAEHQDRKLPEAFEQMFCSEGAKR